MATKSEIQQAVAQFQKELNSPQFAAAMTVDEQSPSDDICARCGFMRRNHDKDSLNGAAVCKGWPAVHHGRGG